MSASSFVRASHRWVSLAFSLTVAAIFVAMAATTPPEWLYYLPLPLLLLQMVTGMWLFALPYLRHRQ